MQRQDRTGNLRDVYARGGLAQGATLAMLFGILAIGFVVGTLFLSERRLSLSQADQLYEGTELDGMATDFRLTDHNGAVVALSDFRGMVIVLAFLDSQCREVCPLTAVQLRETYRSLSEEEANAVVFLGVNVNTEANGVADVAQASQKWRLTEIPAWRFLTGTLEALETVWQAYSITVWVPPEGGELLHTPGIYLIDQFGQKRWYVSTPFDEEGSPELPTSLSNLLVKHIRELQSEHSR